MSPFPPNPTYSSTMTSENPPTIPDPWDQGDPWEDVSTIDDPWTDHTTPWLESGEDAPQPEQRAQMYSYEKISLIAQHGQGQVWLAKAAGSDAQYAQKYLLRADQQDDTKRFLREVRIQSMLDHPGIMPIHAFDFEADTPWYVMPLASRSLRDLMTDKGALSEDDTVDILLQVAAALSYAHGEGVVHRDVKPENFLELDGKWVVSDFGLCRDWTADSTTVTRTGVALGTLPYMPPEQFTSPHQAEATADVFALGRVLYECLTGRSPWPHRDPDLVPARFKYIFTKATNDDASKRYGTMAELIADLKSLTSTESDDLALPVEHAQDLAEDVLKNKANAAAKLTAHILRNLSDEVFLKKFLPSALPPVLAALRAQDTSAFNQMVRAFDRAAEGDQPFAWTDLAATFLQRVFAISADPDIRELCLHRILVLGTEHNRWAVRDMYVKIISQIHDPAEVLMVSHQLGAYPQGAAFVRDGADHVSLPLRIRQALLAA